MGSLGIILVIVLALWSITKTVEKIANNILENQQKQIMLLEQINARLNDK